MSVYDNPPDDQSSVIAAGLRAAYRAGYADALEAAAKDAEAIIDTRSSELQQAYTNGAARKIARRIRSLPISEGRTDGR